MTGQDLERLEAAAHKQCEQTRGAMVAITPRTLLELCRLARIGAEQEAQARKPT